MGRKPTPTATLLLRGSPHANRRSSEPTVAPELPDPPAWLGDNARAHWPAIGGMLLSMNLMGKPYTIALALLCAALADYIEARDLAALVEPVVTTSKGGLMQHPQVGIRNAAWKRAMVALREFGLSPSALRGVTAATSPPDSLSRYSMNPFPRLADREVKR